MLRADVVVAQRGPRAGSSSKTRLARGVKMWPSTGFSPSPMISMTEARPRP